MSITPAQCRAARAITRITRQELSDAAGVSIRTIIYLEDEQRTPGHGKLDAIRRAFEKRGISFIEMSDRNGLLEPAGEQVTNEHAPRNSIIPSFAELYTKGVCESWEEMWEYLHHRRSPPSVDERKLCIQFLDDTAIQNIDGDGTYFTVDMNIPRIVRSSLVSVKTSADGTIMHTALSVLYSSRNLVRFTNRTYMLGGASTTPDTGQVLFDLEGKAIRITSAARIFDDKIEHPEYFKRSLEKCNIIASAHGQIASSEC